jgi:hypothetical protein
MPQLEHQNHEWLQREKKKTQYYFFWKKKPIMEVENETNFSELKQEVNKHLCNFED